jgi:hypothetical protein
VTPVLDLKTWLKLTMRIHSKKAAIFKDFICDKVVRYLGGDVSLLDEIRFIDENTTEQTNVFKRVVRNAKRTAAEKEEQRIAKEPRLGYKTHDSYLVSQKEATDAVKKFCEKSKDENFKKFYRPYPAFNRAGTVACVGREPAEIRESTHVSSARTMYNAEHEALNILFNKDVSFGLTQKVNEENTNGKDFQEVIDSAYKESSAWRLKRSSDRFKLLSV